MDDSPDQSSPLSATGVVGLDNILGGGLTPSRLYLIEGNPGSGKTTLALQYLLEGVRRKEPRLYVTLSETKAELTAVAKSHGWSLEGIEIVELTASEAELEPDNQHTMFQPADVELGQTTKAVLAEVERVKPRRVVIDSLSELRLLAQSSLRYLHAMPEEDFLTVQMHELLTYLGHKGVVTFLVLAQHGMIGSMQAPVDTTYLADTVVLFRYFEAHGEVRQAISVVKKRSGKHERTIRELKLDNGIRVGEPLKEFRGVLTGTPTFDGEGDTLMGPANA